MWQGMNWHKYANHFYCKQMIRALCKKKKRLQFGGSPSRWILESLVARTSHASARATPPLSAAALATPPLTAAALATEP